MKCPNCNAELAETARFCNKCGCKIEAGENTIGREFNETVIADTSNLTAETVSSPKKNAKVKTKAEPGSEQNTLVQTKQEKPKLASSVVISVCAVLVLVAIAVLWFFVIAPAREINSITVYPAELELEAGQQSEIVTIISPDSASDKAVHWVSDNPAVATVNNGIVSAVKAGRVTITVISAKNAEVFAKVNVVVAATIQSTPTSEPSDDETQFIKTAISHIDKTLYSVLEQDVYPNALLTDTQVSVLNVRELQYYINAIYAKNGYSFSTQEAADFFMNMPWYMPISENQQTVASNMSSVDKTNLDLLLQWRNQQRFDTSITGVDSIWTARIADGRIGEGFAMSLSSHDVQLLAATILAKHGYIFENSTLQAIFEGQSFYRAYTADPAKLDLSEQDIENLTLLLKYLY